MSKEAALALVRGFASSNGIGVWARISSSDLVEGLNQRIANPDLIDQQGTPLCGPSALVRAVATNDPVAYARTVIDLFKYGKARLRSLEIKPGAWLKAVAPQGGAHPVDWIIIAGIRDSENYIFSMASGWMEPAGITFPRTLERWMKKVGYTDIVNKTYLAAKPIYMALAAEAAHAGRLVNLGYQVAMFIDGDMLDPKTQDDVFSLHPDHWVALTSPIENIGSGNSQVSVSFTVYSWGKIPRVPIDPQKPLSKDKFLHKYYGFIAGRY